MHGVDQLGRRGSDLLDRVSDQPEIIGKPNFQPVQEIFKSEEGWRVSQAVAWIAKTRKAPATGFLISPNRLMTCWHVFERRRWANGAVARLGYDERDENPQDEFLPYVEYKLDPRIFFYNNEALDFAVVGVADHSDEGWRGKAGNRWGTISFPSPAPAIPEKVIIIQHPHGRPKEVVLTDNEVVRQDGDRIWYLADTEPGSSGSPVFNESFELVALHRGWRRVRDSSSNGKTLANEGVLATAILADYLQNDVQARRRRGCLLK